jgi:hypothetical protein
LYYLQCLTNYLDDVAIGYKIFTFWACFVKNKYR